MVHFCICGAHEGHLGPDKKTYVTIFGACELTRPTVAKQIIDMRRRAAAGLPKTRSHFFVTICAATELKAPTLAEEYLDMQEAVKAGVITLEEWDSAVARLSAEEAFQIGSFTIMGAFDGSEVPSENEEVEGLALNRHLGHIPEQAGTTLELGVGQRGSQRTAVLRRALTATA
ncbi:MAG: hypothetical protein IID39_02120 [Planctomycetes bacterium]|nr:hypothetical protein [Planctomycetota bacterium]